MIFSGKNPSVLSGRGEKARAPPCYKGRWRGEYPARGPGGEAALPSSAGEGISAGGTGNEREVHEIFDRLCGKKGAFLNAAVEEENVYLTEKE